MVSDRDIAAKIREAAPGGTLADVLAAWDLVRARLDSRDDSDTARAFREVLDRYRATPPSDRAAANPDDPQIYAKAEWILRHLDLAKDSATQLLWLRNELTMVIAAARRDEREKWAIDEGPYSDKKRADKIARILGCIPSNPDWNSYIRDIICELRGVRADADAKVEELEAAARKAIPLLKRYRDMVTPDTATAGAIPEDVLATEVIDALAALVNPPKPEEVEK